VIAVARRGEAPLKQVAKDFGISESCLANSLRAADVEDGTRPVVTRDESAELRNLSKRNRLLEQENEVLRKAAAYLAQGNLPGNRSRWPRRSPVPGQAWLSVFTGNTSERNDIRSVPCSWPTTFATRSRHNPRSTDLIHTAHPPRACPHMPMIVRSRPVMPTRGRSTCCGLQQR
jgi:transposase